jgi:hypothetical protein
MFKFKPAYASQFRHQCLVDRDKSGTTGQWRSVETYDFNNVGLAVVTSTTADVYALRLHLRDVRPLIAYDIRPSNLPPDKNIIAFPISPKYVKQGCLDGMSGTESDPDYPPYERYKSYYKPGEAYALK